VGRDHRIIVAAAPVGWSVSLDDLQPLMFLSGPRAEQHARELAMRLARLGDDTQVTVHDHTQELVSTAHYAAK